MREQFSLYIAGLYRGVPSSVYMELLLLLCFGTVLIVSFKGIRKGWKLIPGLLVLEYVFLICCSTILYRPYKEVVEHNFTPYWSYVAIENGRIDLLAEIIMNVVVFVPVGLLLSCVSNRLKWWMVLLVGCGISMSIESLQFVLKRGFSEFDDLFHNTLGCLIGIMIVALAKEIWQFCSFLFVPQWGKLPKEVGIMESSN